MPSALVNARLIATTNGALRRAEPLVDGALLCIAYFAAGKLGLGLAFENSSATPVWPPSGIALATILARGHGFWPVIFLGAFLVNITTAGSTLACLGIAAGNTLEGVLGAHLVSRFCGGRQAFERVPDVFRFAGLAAVASTAIAATIGMACLFVDGLASGPSLGSVWLTWWLGDAVGILLVAPPLLLWSAGARAGWTRARAVEGALLVLVVLLTSAAVFGGWFPWRARNYPLEFLCLLPLLWAALRFQPRGASAAILVLSGVAIHGTLGGYGPLARFAPHESLLLLQAFLGAAALTALALAASASERQRSEKQLLYMVEHDPLTGVLSRKRFEAELQHELAMALRYRTRGAVLFLDLDDFKAVNDQFGHSDGDRLLVDVARMLSSVTRSIDTVARFGGDEFAVLIEDADLADAQATADRVVERLSAVITLDEREVTAKASVGIAVQATAGVTAEELVRRADIAMYAAKARGGGCHATYEPSLYDATLARMELKADLRGALERGEMHIAFQPIVDLASEALVGTEALIRWAHPRRGPVAPLDFIPIAEENGIIRSLGRWVLESAVVQTRAWQAASGRSDLTVSVNLSGRQIADPALPADVARILTDTGFDPRALILEITESVLVGDDVETMSTLHALKALGVRLAIDDFGTGYSSLSYLGKFPVDILKIDRSFVAGLDGNPESTTLISSILDLSSRLHLETVAEGVEEATQRDTLRKLGARHGQGYLFARPMPAPDIGALLSNPRPTEPRSGQPTPINRRTSRTGNVVPHRRAIANQP
jgi:diguanylate cyclase (GGDEF)-like protein